MFPPGFRFIPTTIELLDYYLRNKNLNPNFTCQMIVEENVYLHHPSTLINNHSESGENVWYFFSPRERKYENGQRPNRQAGNGSWKASGKRKTIKDINGNKIGYDTALVYYDGRIKGNEGIKSNWIMHEFWSEKFQIPLSEKNMKLNDWVICKIYETNLRNSNSSPGQNPDSCLDKKKFLAEGKGIQIREELVNKEKAQKGNSNYEGKGKGILIEDGEENDLKSLKAMIRRSREEEFHSGVATNHAYASSSSSSPSHQESQHIFLAYDQSAPQFEINEHFESINDLSAPIYDEQVNGASGQNIEDQNPVLEKNYQFDASGFGQNSHDQFIDSMDYHDLENGASSRHEYPNPQNIEDQNPSSLVKSYQFAASGFGQNPHDQIIDPIDHHYFDFDDSEIYEGDMSLLKEHAGILECIGFLREDEDSSSHSGVNGSSSSSAEN